jgi:hypothetical protein
MATPTTYTFSVILHTPNDKVDFDSLTDEINQSSITTALSHLYLNSDVLEVVMKDVLSVEDEATLTAILAAHVGEQFQSPMVVAIKGESKPTQGFYQAVSFIMNVTPGLTPTTREVSWPFDTSLISGKFQVFGSELGDKFEALAAPDTVIGMISEDVAQGATQIPVSDTVLANAAVGFQVNFQDTSNGSVVSGGRILAISKASSTITIETPLSAALTAFPPTLVRISVSYVDAEVIDGQDMITLGQTLQGASHVAANRIVRFKYTNGTETQTVKRVLIVLEIYY